MTPLQLARPLRGRCNSIGKLVNVGIITARDSSASFLVDDDKGGILLVRVIQYKEPTA